MICMVKLQLHERPDELSLDSASDSVRVSQEWSYLYIRSEDHGYS